MKKSFLLYVMFHLSWSFSQITFYQDICKCGVTGAGYSFALSTGNNIGEFEIHIEPNSTIKKAFLFSHRFGLADPITIQLNNNNFTFNEENRVSSIFLAAGNFFAKEQSVHVVDATNFIDPNEQQYTVSFPDQNSCMGCSYGNVFLVVIYENLNFNENLSTYILLNNQNENFLNNFTLQNLNSKNHLFPALFSVYSDRIGDSEPFDGSIFKLNNNQIGVLKGSDNVNNTWDGAGVKGHFYYQNSIAVGLDDDNENTPINNSDGIMDVSSYISSNSLNWQTQWETNTPPYNIFSGFFLTYTSPCSAFPTQTSSDTTLCFGTTAQLFASGGGSTGSAPAYEWQPAVGLSCTDCPNPIVTADSSRLYTVRIRNNDSCSVVRPIKVNVKPLPEFSSVVSKPSICGAATGQILLGADYVGETYSINGGTPQTSGTFSNLSAGTYTVSLNELNGCNRDTLVVVGDTSLTQAYFTATPQSGAAPLWVLFSNQSTNANEFSWSINGEPQGGNLSSFTFDTNGVYSVKLVAWQFDPSCADTFSVLISVYDCLVVQIPNVFTPNHDGNNDFFGVTVNRPCAISFSILNRWGNVIQSGTVPTLGGFVPLWSGSNAPDGTYFYQIEFQADDLKQVEVRQGFVERR